MNYFAAIAVGIVFAIIALILTFAFGVANQGQPTVAFGNCGAFTDAEILQWDGTNWCFQGVDVNSVGGSTITVDEQGVQKQASLGALNFLAAFDITTDGTDANVAFDITEASLTTDSIWVGSSGLASEAALSSINAGTATALASNPSDCTGIQVATAIAASGDLTCVSITDGMVPNDITIDNAATADALAANGTNCASGEAARGVDAAGNAEDCFTPAGGGGGSSTITVDENDTQVLAALTNLDFRQGLDVATNTGEAIVTLDVTEASLTTDSVWVGSSGLATATALSSINVGTATALAANPTDCSADEYAHTIDAQGNLTCTTLGYQVVLDEEENLGTWAAINFTGAGIDCNLATPNIDCTVNAVDADDLSDNSIDDLSDVVVTTPADASFLIYDTGSGTWSDFALSGDITCTDSGVCTVSNAATADALTNNPTDCSANQFANAIAANGDLTCDSVDISDDTNLAANTGTRLTGDTVQLDDFSIALGLASVSADDDDVLQWGPPRNVTFGYFSCSTSTGVATISADVRSATTPNSAGDTLFSNLPCDTDRQSTTSFTRATVTTDDLVSFQIVGISTGGINLRISKATGTYD